MRSTYQALYLSPHLDDAVLSCGGQIAARARRGESVLVATLATGDPTGPLSPLAQELHAAWGLGGSCAARREEDRRACVRLGAAVHHVDRQEAMYRLDPETGQPLYSTRESVFGPIHAQDAFLPALTTAMKSLPPADVVVAPLGAGGHVDHRLVRQAAEVVFGRSVVYYEDYPYAGKGLAIRKLVWPPWRWRSRTMALSPENLRARCAAVAEYASQIEMLFAGAENLESKIERYVRRVGGERMWVRRYPVPLASTGGRSSGSIGACMD